MAGDWIKLRKDLISDPAVIRLGIILDLEPFAVVGRLAAVWAWADTHSDCHGRVTLVSRACLDSVAQRAGFGDALVSVGWLADIGADGAGIQFPRFDRHMGQGAKARACASNRKRNQRLREAEPLRTNGETASRSRHGRVTKHCDATVTREEKRREDIREVSYDTSCPELATPTSVPEPVASEPTSSALVTIPIQAEPPALTIPCSGTGVKEWHLSAAKVAEWSEAFPGVDVLAECRKARQWLIDNPKRAKTASGMARFLGSWLSRSQDRAPSHGTVPRPHLDNAGRTESRIASQAAEAMRLWGAEG